MHIHLSRETWKHIRAVAARDIATYTGDSDWTATVQLCKDVHEEIPRGSVGTLDISPRVLSYILIELDNWYLSTMNLECL
jgi:hypothetical protein